MSDYLTLEAWAACAFRTPPKLPTLRRWARAGIIAGARKIGRTYYVPADAELVDRAPIDVASDDPVVNAILQS